ncbi:hypothetical protein [Pseudomonas capsici]|uniref:hypothetical protein n=1 Tax=Pseudomonas capsici TaxID=2810614 RepID=UPI0021F13B6A|nr:hypothetical protein [Pseudomonas capsici]MCV4285042.1 hypothetical protein [Pseudomonas capsici]
MPEEKVVMYESAEAASIQTVTGWVDANGRFWGKDEHTARYCGSTHRKCDKDHAHPIYEIRSYCHICYQAGREAKFAAMPKKEWAGEPLVIFDGDRHFFDEDSLRDYLVEEEVDLESVQLCICEPNYPREIDPNDHFCDDLPDDGEINDDQILAAFDLLNEMIRASGPLSWSEGKYAASLPQKFIDSVLAEKRGAA